MLATGVAAALAARKVILFINNNVSKKPVYVIGIFNINKSNYSLHIFFHDCSKTSSILAAFMGYRRRIWHGLS